MSTSTATDDERLKRLLKAAIIEVLEERRDLVRDVVGEALEDVALARAIAGAGDGERVEWSLISRGALADAYDDGEPEYSTDLIKEPNPEYERR
ncbi:MAG TPA: hypothetical protein VG148_08760 [Pyrinomonadaceae bacterium]|nr:hypothetical protein [Pyrinomonadaceae bacterium]